MQTATYLRNPANIGYLDMFVRLAIGALFLAVLFTNKGEMHAWLAATALASIYPLVTALCRWDPLYEAADISTAEPFPDYYFALDELGQGNTFAMPRKRSDTDSAERRNRPGKKAA